MTDMVLQSKTILERFRVDGWVALVTGGGQGIGRAYAHALAEAGAAVAVDDIIFPRSEQVVAELKAKGIDALAIEADVRQADQVQKMISAVMERWGRLTIGVNNAGIGAWISGESVSTNEWDEMMNVNLKGVFLCAQAEAQVMLKA